MYNSHGTYLALERVPRRFFGQALQLAVPRLPHRLDSFSSRLSVVD